MCREGVGFVSISRDPELFFAFEPLWIHIDGRKEGSILTGERRILHLSEGKHKVWVEYDDVLLGKFMSNRLIIDIIADSFLLLECGSSYQGMRFIFSSFYILNHDGCFFLRETEA
jgi:hypothetical protein